MRLLLLLLVVLLIGGGGFSGYWFGIKGEPIPGFDDADTQTASEAEKARTDGRGSEFVEMKPLSLPIMQEGRVTELRTLVISLEVAGTKGMQSVSSSRPQLRDAMLEELHGLYSLRFVRDHEDEMQIVRTRLLKRGKAILGDELRGVYVQAVQGRDVN